MPADTRGVKNMCEIFGVSAAGDFYANDCLKTFYSHSDMHPHGWGLACVDRNGALIEKESVKASNSNYLRERLSQPVRSGIILAHIRFATIGNVEYKNCHPFSGRDSDGRRWTLIHNGTIFDCPPLNRYVKKQSGDTDSERVFLYILDRLNGARREKGQKLRFEERFELLDQIVCEMAQGNKLNLLFTDGKYLYAHTNCKHTLHYLSRDDSVIISTQPLDNCSGWRELEFGRLLAFHRGKQVKAGTAHGHEYVEDKEAMKLLYQIFANL